VAEAARHIKHHFHHEEVDILRQEAGIQLQEAGIQRQAAGIQDQEELVRLAGLK